MPDLPFHWLVLAVLAVGLLLFIRQKATAKNTESLATAADRRGWRYVEGRHLVVWQPGRIGLASVDHLLDYASDILDRTPDSVWKS